MFPNSVDYQEGRFFFLALLPYTHTLLLTGTLPLFKQYVSSAQSRSTTHIQKYVLKHRHALTETCLLILSLDYRTTYSSYKGTATSNQQQR